MSEEKYLPLTTSKPRFFYGYVVVLASFIITMVTFGAMYTFGVFFQPLVAEFGWTRAVTAIAYSLSMVLHGLFYIVTGRLNDRFGPRIVLTASGFFLGLGYLLMSQVNTIWQLYLFYGVIIAIGVSGVYVPLMSTVARWFVKTRGTMIGIVLAGSSVGVMIMPPLAEWLVATYGWRTAFTVIGVIVLLFSISAAQFLRYSPAQVGQRPYGSVEVKEDNRGLAAAFSFPQAVKTGQFWLLLVVLFCQRFSIQAIIVHIVPHALDQGMSAITAASMLTVIGGLSLAGRIVLGGLSDRIGSKPSFAISFLLMSVALFWVLAAREVWMLYLFAAAFGFAHGGMYVLSAPLVAELFGLRALGVILGVITFGGTIGGAISPILAGHIFDLSGSYQPAFLIGAIIAIVGLIAVWRVRPVISSRRSA